MAISYFGEGDSKKAYVVPHLRQRKIGDGYLITNDFGAWAHLDPEELRSLRSGRPGSSLLGLLESRGIVLARSNHEDVIADSRRRCGFLFQGASLHIMAPTLRCNIRCVYCQSGAMPKSEKHVDMSPETARKAVDFIFQSPSSGITIEFQGGEPLLRWDIIRLVVEYAKELNKKHNKILEWNIVTNLIEMSEDKLDFFIKHKIGICTSLDGPEELHNKNRGCYDKTAYWIRKIAERHHLNAMPLITRHSLSYPTELVNEYVRLGLRRTWIKPLNNLGYAAQNWDRIGITEEQFIDFYKKALRHIIKVNEKTFFIERYTHILLRKIIEKDSVNYLDLQSPCGAAIGQLAYSYDGSIFTCDEGRFFRDVFRLGTVDDSYKEVLSSANTQSIIKASINDNPVCEACAYKPFCGLCPVCSYGETGNLVPKLPDRRCRILMAMFDYVFEKLLFDESYRKVFLSWVENSKKYK